MGDTLIALYEELKETVEAAEGDMEKFAEKGNKSAGTRVRGAMQSIKKLAQDIRIEVQERKNTA